MNMSWIVLLVYQLSDILSLIVCHHDSLVNDTYRLHDFIYLLVDIAALLETYV